MKCPKCNKTLARLEPNYHLQLPQTDYKDIEFECRNGHRFFTRIKPEDLIEVIDNG